MHDHLLGRKTLSEEGTLDITIIAPRLCRTEVAEGLPLVDLEDHLLSVVDRVEVPTVGDDDGGVLRSLGVIIDHEVVEGLRLRVLAGDVDGVARDVLREAPLRYRQLG